MSVPQSIFRFGNTALTKPSSGVVYTRTFASSSAQLSWMQARLTTVKEGNYEVRPYSGRYRGNWCADDIISCNYCMFTTTRSARIQAAIAATGAPMTSSRATTACSPTASDGGMPSSTVSCT